MQPKPFCRAAYEAALQAEFSHIHADKKLRKFARAILSVDLSVIDGMLAPTYSRFGPKPYPPSSLFIACLLMVFLRVTGFTVWAKQLKEDPVYARLCGFAPDKTPEVGTFYNFIARLWASDKANFRDHVRPKKDRPKKPGGKNEKADPPSNETIATDIKKWCGNVSKESEPYRRFFRLFRIFLEGSVSRGLISKGHLGVSGDGTPVVTMHRERSHRVCDCHEKGIERCDCYRWYSQPDSFWGWDSSRNCHYIGYNLYLLTASDAHSDLPIFPLLLPASRHDGRAFVEAYAKFQAFCPDFHTERMQLDSAHDAMPIYQWMLEDKVTAFINLNTRKTKFDWKDLQVTKDGRPICPEGKAMHRDGTDDRMRMKFRCPCLKHEKGSSKKFVCGCEHPCTDSTYGPVKHIPLADNPRIFCTPARGSDAWGKEYKKRTSSERDNKRIKEDYKLEDGRHRSSMMWYFRLYLILMAIHVDAWDTAGLLDASSLPAEPAA